jgi:alpha-galactosidase
MRRVAIAGVLTLIAATLTSTHAVSAVAVQRFVQHGDAFVDGDHTSGEWTIGNASIRYTLRATRNGPMRAVMLSVPGASSPITRPRATDATLTIDGDVIRLGAPDSGFVVESITPAEGTHFASLAVRLTSRARGLAATRYYVVYEAAPAVEMWTTVETLDEAPRTVHNLNAVEHEVGVGEVHYVTGLDTPASEGGSFTRQRRTLQPGERFMLGSPTLSSELALPLVTIERGEYRIFAGLAWSGAWSSSIDRDDDGLVLAMGLPPMSAVARPGQSIEGPHAFLGVAPAADHGDVAALTRFVRESRGGRPLPALTTFNTWFVRGINIDEEVVRRDIDYAASVGIELFQLDAGWYPRARPQNAFDFTDGLGSWRADSARFPGGLAALATYAHERNMQFGLWVEPERVALDTVGQPGLAEERYLATQDGAYQPGVANEHARDGQICLADRAAREWVTAKLFALLDEVQPDNLKWDFNRWVHCTRADHGHPVDGGNYAHTRALYEILAEVRSRYPHLTIENCSGGGHRVDFGLARLTDTAWMDDRSAPSTHVRHNLHGLLALFPASYLFSYVMPHSDEPLHGSEDLALTVRSRLPGVVGLATSLDQLSEGELNVLHQEFELARRLRSVQQDAITYVLTPQRAAAGDWEVVQQFVPESGISYLFAYGERASGSVRVHPVGVQADLTYELRSADRGTIGRLRGADVIANGLEVLEAPESAAQILVLQPLSPQP